MTLTSDTLKGMAPASPSTSTNSSDKEQDTHSNGKSSKRQMESYHQHLQTMYSRKTPHPLPSRRCISKPKIRIFHHMQAQREASPDEVLNSFPFLKIFHKQSIFPFIHVQAKATSNQLQFTISFLLNILQFQYLYVRNTKH